MMNLEQQKETLSDLAIESELGSISVPKNTERAKFLSDGFEQSFQKPDGSGIVIRIKPDELRNVLLTVDGTTIFKCMESRFFILARVGNIHLPFYQSSKGTGGKAASIWHPYFGITHDGWIIKGHGDKNNPTGVQEYHPKITEVQEQLNQNLILQSGSYYSAGGKIGTNRSSTDFEPQNVIFDINEHLNYMFWARDQKYGGNLNNAERQMLVDHTGYNPNDITGPDPDDSELEERKSPQWISEIISRIR